MTIDVVEEVLSWPKNIDIYIYAPGSGGEFFTSLCSLAHFPTREILTSKNLNVSKISATSENLNNFLVFESQKYFNPELTDISEIGKHIYFLSKYMDPITKINYLKYVIFHVILNNGTLKNINGFNENFSSKREFIKNINIVLCTHWQDIKKSYKSDLKPRTFGIPLFEKEKNLNVINLDPQTEKGREFVINFCAKTNLVTNTEKIKNQFEHSAFNNIKLQFPFFDYVIKNDTNSIKDYIENRYGSDLDFDFIDQALIDYKKIRVDPYL
jgi:hypothetical protein